jgi:hypothetical protein
MSESIAELARQEAEAAEAEYPDRDEESELETETEPEPDTDEDQEPGVPPNLPPEEPSDAMMERIGRELDKEAQRHAKAVAKIMGDQMSDLLECPLCVTPGYVTSQPPELDDMERLAVLSYIGEGGEPRLVQHPELYRCEFCDGWGDVETGSRRGTITVACPECDGRGYKDRRTERELAVLNGGTAQPVSPPASYNTPAPATGGYEPGQITQGGFTFPPTPGASPDPAGRMPGHPLWGLPHEAGGL